MTDEELCTYIEAAARRLPLVRGVEIDNGVRLAFEDGTEVVALPLPGHRLVRLYAACRSHADESCLETALGDEEDGLPAQEDEGESVELRTDDDGRWFIYCAEDERTFTLVLDLSEDALDQPHRDEIVEHFVDELEFWTKTLAPFARPGPHAAAHPMTLLHPLALN